MNFATMLTASRIAVAPVFAYVFIRGYKGSADDVSWIYICVGLAIFIELTDLFDGMVARATKTVTDLGKVFDPVADSVSRQTIFIAFMLSGIMPLWMYLVIFYRDAFMQLLRIICASNGFVQAARLSGKIKAVLQGVATFTMLAIIFAIRKEVTWMPSEIGGRHPGYWVMLAVAGYTLLSVIDYIIPNRAIIAKMMSPKKS